MERETFDRLASVFGSRLRAVLAEHAERFPGDPRPQFRWADLGTRRPGLPHLGAACADEAGAASLADGAALYMRTACLAKGRPIDFMGGYTDGMARHSYAEGCTFYFDGRLLGCATAEALPVRKPAYVAGAAFRRYE